MVESPEGKGLSFVPLTVYEMMGCGFGWVYNPDENER
jgi:hypothetical protein